MGQPPGAGRVTRLGSFCPHRQDSWTVFMRSVGNRAGGRVGMSELVEVQANPPAAQEAWALAREMAAAFGNLVEAYREHYKLSGPEALARADSPQTPQYQEQ